MLDSKVDKPKQVASGYPVTQGGTAAEIRSRGRPVHHAVFTECRRAWADSPSEAFST